MMSNRQVFHIKTGSREFELRFPLNVADTQTVEFLETGTIVVLQIVGGGIKSMAITEAFGESDVGKTLVSHTLCVTAQQLGEDGIPRGKVFYLDTHKTFRSDRVRAIAERFDMDPATVRNNVVNATAGTSEHLMELLDIAAAKFQKEVGVFKLMIIDSIMAPIRADFRKPTEWHQKLNQVLSRLQEISKEYNIAVFITNQLPAPMEPKFGQITRVWDAMTRVSLMKGLGDLRIGKIIKRPEEVATFAISAEGVIDE